MKKTLVLVAALAAAGAAWAQSPARTPVEQKEALVRRLLNDSPAVTRIEASGDAEARAFFGRARERHASAVILLQAGQPERAESELNEAMWLAGKARQRVPDTMRRSIELRVQNRAMMLAIDSLRGSYQRQLARTRGVDPATGPRDEALAAIDSRIEEAASFGNSEHVERVNTVLKAVERDLMAALSRILGSASLDYTQRFATQAEEFAFEVARNHGYQDLLPVAREVLGPDREASSAMAGYVAHNAARLERAQKSAARGDYAAALGAVREGTALLQAALTAAGLVVPRESSLAAGGSQ